MKKLLLTLSAASLLAAADNPIHDRKVNQQQRIAKGVANGSLTPHETARLERKESRLNHEIRHDRNVNGGNLTNKEKAQITRQQNHLSRSIYRQKHDNQGR